jgi:hypothetical protein
MHDNALEHYLMFLSPLVLYNSILFGVYFFSKLRHKYTTLMKRGKTNFSIYT